MRQTKYRFFLLPLIFVLACVGAFAQANSELTGIVTDQTGAVVPERRSRLTDPATGTVKVDGAAERPACTNFRFEPRQLQHEGRGQGLRDLRAERHRGQRFLDRSASTSSSRSAPKAQTVTVEADALAVQADSNVVSTLISSEQISQIATENRNFAALAALGLGVSSALPDQQHADFCGANFTISVNGLRQSHNIWLIDGGEADDRGGAGGMDIMPSQDAIAEFTMMTSNYPPDYGISSGATMSLSLKSGTQKFHGEAFEFNRNTDYDANNYFNKYNTTTPTPRQVLNYNIYGVQHRRPAVHSQGLQPEPATRPSSSGTKSGARSTRAIRRTWLQHCRRRIFRPPAQTWRIRFPRLQAPAPITVCRTRRESWCLIQAQQRPRQACRTLLRTLPAGFGCQQDACQTALLAQYGLTPGSRSRTTPFRRLCLIRMRYCTSTRASCPSPHAADGKAFTDGTDSDQGARRRPARGPQGQRQVADPRPLHARLRHAGLGTA